MTNLSDLKNLGKIPWDQRYALIKEHFPSASMDWNHAFEDIDLLGRVLRDILKADQSQPGRSGPRPVLDRKLAEARLRQFKGADYTELPFRDAFKILAAGRSHRHLASKVGLDRNMVQKLLAGTREPDFYIMEVVAKAFGKDPSYFLEYRIGFVLGALGSQMELAPEMTVDLYKRLSGRYGSN